MSTIIATAEQGETQTVEPTRKQQRFIRKTLKHGDITKVSLGENPYTTHMLPIYAELGGNAPFCIVMEISLNLITRDVLTGYFRHINSVIKDKNTVIDWNKEQILSWHGYTVILGELGKINPYEETQSVRVVNPTPASSSGPLGAETADQAQVAQQIIGGGIQEGMQEFTEHLTTIINQLEATLQVHINGIQTIVNTLQEQRTADQEALNESLKQQREGMIALIKQQQEGLADTRRQLQNAIAQASEANRQILDLQLEMLEAAMERIALNQIKIMCDSLMQSQEYDPISQLIELVDNLLESGTTTEVSITTLIDIIDSLFNQTKNRFEQLKETCNSTNNSSEKANIIKQMNELNIRALSLIAMKDILDRST